MGSCSTYYIDEPARGAPPSCNKRKVSDSGFHARWRCSAIVTATSVPMASGVLATWSAAASLALGVVVQIGAVARTAYVRPGSEVGKWFFSMRVARLPHL